MKAPDKSQFIFFNLMLKAKAPRSCWERWQHHDPKLLLSVADKIKQHGADPRSLLKGWKYFDNVADVKDYNLVTDLTDEEQTALVGESYDKYLSSHRAPHLTFARRRK